jgi:hypothetical protein
MPLGECAVTQLNVPCVVCEPVHLMIHPLVTDAPQTESRARTKQ